MTRISLRANIVYHVYNRRVLKGTLFRSRSDYNCFIIKINTLKAKYSIEVLSYCLMPNHFHFMVLVNELDATVITDGVAQSDAVGIQRSAQSDADGKR